MTSEPGLREVWGRAVSGDHMDPDSVLRIPGFIFAALVSTPGAVIGRTIGWWTHGPVRFLVTIVLGIGLYQLPPVAALVHTLVHMLVWITRS